MSALRNELVDAVFEQYPVDAILTCDSDVLLEPEGAEKLLSVDADLVCAPVRNGDRAYDVFTYIDRGLHRGRITRDDTRSSRVIPVASGGAALLIHRRCWDAGLRYEPSPQSENPGLGNAAKRLGLKYRCHLGVRTVHWMEKDKAYDSHGE